MKRMLRYAAENGYDKLAWTTGEQQAERYDLSKQVDYITRESNLDGDIYVDISTTTSMINLMTNSDGVIISQKGATNVGDFRGKGLDEVIGKEVAQKVLSAKGEVKFEGNDLKVGGEGMKGFYDTILPAFMNKYAKKWGAKVGESELTTQKYDPEYARKLPKGFAITEDKKATVHSIPITPSMRESVMQGQPMFADKGNAPATEHPITQPFIQSIWGDSKIKDNGTFQTITTPAGVRILLSSVAKITPNEIAFNAGRSSSLKDSDITGEFRKVSDNLGTIKLVRDKSGDWTLAHESGHALQELILNQTDRSLLKDYVKSLVNRGILKANDAANHGNKEDISDFIADQLTGNTEKYKPNSTINRIIAKLRDFVEKLKSAFGVRTVNQVVEDIKTGQILHGRGV
ncbi:hypothetical protein EHM76_01210, partial [bacterium]